MGWLAAGLESDCELDEWERKRLQKSARIKLEEAAKSKQSKWYESKRKPKPKPNSKSKPKPKPKPKARSVSERFCAFNMNPDQNLSG